MTVPTPFSFLRVALFSLTVLSMNKTFAQQSRQPAILHPIGIFDDHTDIGNPQLAGSAVFDSVDQTYAISGSGFNLWFNGDEFQFVYKKIKGDFIVTANFAFLGATGNGHRKIGWMVRESTDSAAAHVSAVKHGDGLTVMQWRELRGAYMRDPEDEIFVAKRSPDVIQLERKGQKIIMRMAQNGEPLEEVGSHVMPYLKNEALIGLFICSHDPSVIERAKVWNVRIDQPVYEVYTSDPHAPAAVPVKVGGSRLEIISVKDGMRKDLYDSEEGLGDLGWSTDGRQLFYNANSRSYSLKMDGNGVKAEQVQWHSDAPVNAFVKKYNYFSQDSTGTTQIWRKKPDGTDQEQVTFDEYHNWYPQTSPDGKWLIFLSCPPNTNPDMPPVSQPAMLRVMPLSGGAPKVIAYLSGGNGSLGKACWSPDGKYVAFISYY